MPRTVAENVVFTFLEGIMMTQVVLVRDRFGYAFLTSNWVAWLLYLTNIGFLAFNGGHMMRLHPEWFVFALLWLIMPIYHFVSRWQWVQRALGQEVWDFRNDVPPDYAGRSWWFAPVFGLIFGLYSLLVRRLRFLPQNIQIPDALLQVFIEPAVFFLIGTALLMLSGVTPLAPWVGVFFMTASVFTFVTEGIVFLHSRMEDLMLKRREWISNTRTGGRWAPTRYTGTVQPPPPKPEVFLVPELDEYEGSPNLAAMNRTLDANMQAYINDTDDTENENAV